MWRNLWEFFFSNHCSSRREVICLRMPLRSFLKALNSWVASPLDFLESSWQPGVHSTSFVTVSRTLCWNWLDKYILNYPKFQLNWKKKNTSLNIVHCGVKLKILPHSMKYEIYYYGFLWADSCLWHIIYSQGCYS